MKKLSQQAFTRRQWLLLPLAAIGTHLFSSLVYAKEPDAIKSGEAEEGCPLNSGGASLLDSEWRVQSIYRNEIPSAIDIIMKVNKNSLTGSAGCNQYTANFKRVGYTGFKVTEINKGDKACHVIRPVKGGPTINVGDLEGGYLRTLKRMGSVQSSEEQLVFYNRSGNKGMIMQKVS